jgi:hypothetical protein
MTDITIEAVESNQWYYVQLGVICSIAYIQQTHQHRLGSLLKTCTAAVSVIHHVIQW